MTKFIFSFSAATFVGGVLAESMLMVMTGIIVLMIIVVIDSELQNH